jgi:pimeloyl-ACP methyl ester carboxylesterase
MSTKPAIVLVHGGGHSPQSYIKFTTELQDRGFEVHAPQLPSCTGHRPEGTSTQKDPLVVRQVVEQLADEGRTIILIMHSYGGIVGCNAIEDLDIPSRAARGKGGGVAHLIAIAAFIYPEGYSIPKMGREMGEENPLPLVQFNADGSNFIIDPRTSCYADVSDEEAEIVLKTLSVVDTRSTEAEVRIEPWKKLPLTYIHTLQDVIFPPRHQRYLLGKLEAAGHKADVRTFDSSHSPFLSRTRETVEVIEEVAGSVVQR